MLKWLSTKPISTLGPSKEKISNAITELQNLVLDIKDQGHPANYIGVAIKRLCNGSIELTQRALKDTTINNAALDNYHVKSVPAKVKENLHAHKDATPYNLALNYQSAIEKLNHVG
jgi:hypothetical protein